MSTFITVCAIFASFLIALWVINYFVMVPKYLKDIAGYLENKRDEEKKK